MTDPRRHTRRSFVYRRLLAAGASFREVGDSAVAVSVPGAGGSLGLADLSPLPRLGYKGRNALAALAALGLDIPAANNSAVALPQGGLIARLADTEALLLCDPSGPGDAFAACAEISASGCYAVPRRDSHAWFQLIGEQAAECLAKLCGVDLRPHRFANGAAAQASLAAIGAIVIRNDRSNTLAFHVLADSASAPYLWECLIDAMAEFNGKPVGLDDFRDIAGA